MLKRVGLAFLLCLASTGPLFAQATATISGRVVDDASAVLPGVTITVTNTATGAVRDTVTNGEGLYSVPALLPGIYNVRAELTGFAPQLRRGRSAHRRQHGGGVEAGDRRGAGEHHRQRPVAARRVDAGGRSRRRFDRPKWRSCR